MEERRRCSTVQQLELLIEFLERHHELALGRITRSKEARALAARLWSECAEILNSHGPTRTGKEWSKLWNDYKCRVRSKLVNINANQQGTGGGPAIVVNLTPLEDRVATILGRDVGPLPNIRQCALDAGNAMEYIEGEVVVEEAVQEREVEIEILEERVVTPPITAAAPPFPSPTEQTPRRHTLPSFRRLTERRMRNASRPSTTRAPHMQSSRSALDDSKMMVLQIEKLKAETDLENAKSYALNAKSFALIVESIDRFSQKFCQNPNTSRNVTGGETVDIFPGIVPETS